MTKMMPFTAKEGKIIFSIVRKAFSGAQIPLDAKNEDAVLIWFDTLREVDYFSSLRPFQVVNRIPCINNICRKAYLIRLLQRMKTYYPTLYTFYPTSYVLPAENTKFIAAVNRHDRMHIVKPDGGSLGIGIAILNESDDYKPSENLGIAQEYVKSALIDGTKFDLRIYVLVASVTPLVIYVFRDGVARFCSMKNNVSNIYAQLTNTAINRKNPEVDLNKITQMIPAVFQKLKNEYGVDTDLLWRKIDNLIILTILSAVKYMEEGVKEKCPNFGYNRCFQILGFDIIFDENWSPNLLEVNYRPSLEADTDQEKSMKMKMLMGALMIEGNLGPIQELVNESRSLGLKNISPADWEKYFHKSGKKADVDRKCEENAARADGFVKIFPSSSPNQEIYNTIMALVRRMPNSAPGKLPCLLRRPKTETIIGDISFEATPGVEKQQPSIINKQNQVNLPNNNARGIMNNNPRKIVSPTVSKR